MDYGSYYLIFCAVLLPDHDNIMVQFGFKNIEKWRIKADEQDLKVMSLSSKKKNLPKTWHRTLEMHHHSVNLLLQSKFSSCQTLLSFSIYVYLSLVECTCFFVTAWIKQGWESLDTSQFILLMIQRHSNVKQNPEHGLSNLKGTKCFALHSQFKTVFTQTRLWQLTEQKQETVC